MKRVEFFEPLEEIVAHVRQRRIDLRGDGLIAFDVMSQHSVGFFVVENNSVAGLCKIHSKFIRRGRHLGYGRMVS